MSSRFRAQPTGAFAEMLARDREAEDWGFGVAPGEMAAPSAEPPPPAPPEPPRLVIEPPPWVTQANEPLKPEPPRPTYPAPRARREADPPEESAA